MTTTLTPLRGEPVAVSAFAAKYEGVAEAILAVAARLGDLANDRTATSLASDSVRGRASGLADDIRQVHPRYLETALALKEYAVRLEGAQARAESAIKEASQEHNLPNLRYVRVSLEADLLRSAALPWEADMRDDIQRDLRQVTAQIEQGEHELRRAHHEYTQAVTERNRAAEAAILRIAPVLHQLNDNIGDYVRAAVDALADFVALVAQWVAEVMVAIVLALVALIVIIVAVVVLIAALIVVLIVVLAAALVLLAAVIALVLAAIPIIVKLLLFVIAREALTPQMKNVTPESGINSSRHGRGPYDGLLKRNGALDIAGGQDSTVIEITEVLDESGNRVAWRVTLPSTQDWELANGLPSGGPWDPEWDQGGMNDLGSNAALMLAPHMQAAYERAVRQAMTDAGIGPDDPVMLVGWSQGGILAGAIASDRGDSFNVQAIFVAGSPIDHMDIGPEVAVISVQHQGDAVPLLDLIDGRNSSNWATIAAPPQPGEPVHGADSYRKTAIVQVDGPGASPDVVAVRDRQAQFFSNNEVISRYQGNE